MVEKGIADAVGMELPIEEQRGSMVINIGAQTTEISVICGGKIILSKTLKIGGKSKMCIRDRSISIWSENRTPVKRTI